MIATFEVPTVQPVDGTVATPANSSVTLALTKAKMKEGDLVLKGGSSIAGPCWNPQLHAAATNGLVDDDGKPSLDPFEDLKFDLDGDGHPDFVLIAGADTEMHWALYVRRGTCGYSVGTVDGGSIALAAGSSHGLRALKVESVCRTLTCTKVSTRWEFDGHVYAALP